MPEIKVAVLAKAGVKLTFNAAAYEKLGKPDSVCVAAAERDGRHYLRISHAAGAAWPVKPRTLGARATFATCTLGATPCDPGIVHAAAVVEAQWSAPNSVLLAMPDWAAMREEVGVST